MDTVSPQLKNILHMLENIYFIEEVIYTSLN